MKLKLILAFIIGVSFYQIQAQTNDSNNDIEPPIQMDQLDQLSELFQGLDFGDIGSGMIMDTMMIKQFSGGDFESADLDQMMQQMMEMMQMQMSQFDFESMPLDELFEDFDIDSLQPHNLNPDQTAPGDQKDAEKTKNKKKVKTYKL